MDFSLTDEQQLLLDSVDELMERYGTEQYFKECDEKHVWPQEFTDALLENGFQMLGVDEKFGGTPVDVTTLMLVSERICKNGAPIYVYGNLCALKDMTEYGTPEQQEQCFAEVMAGKPGFVLGFTEPGAGSDSSSLASTYQRRDGKVYLNGSKSFMTNAVNSKYMLCVARDADDDPEDRANRSRFSMWWVPLHDDEGNLAQGISIEPLEKIGWNMGNTCELHMQDVELEEKDLVGVEGNGFMQAMVNFEVERLIACAQSLGAAQCAFEDAVRYATQRIQFGKPIGKNQLIQEHITDMYLKIENMRNWVYKTAWKIDNGESVQIDSAVAKLYCGRAAFEVCDTALQVMGGIGYTKDCRISRLWRDQRVYRIGAGTDEIMIHIAVLHHLDVQGRHLPYRVLRLLRGGAAGRARRERERRGRCGIRAGRALPRHGVSRPKRRRHPELVARAAHAHDGILPGAGPEGPRAVGGRHPAHVRAVARVGAPHGAVGAQRGPLRCARHRPCGEGTHHVHAVPFVAGPS